MALLRNKFGLLIVKKNAITSIAVLIKPKALSRPNLLLSIVSGSGAASSVKSTGVSGLGVASANSAGMSRSATGFDTL